MAEFRIKNGFALGPFGGAIAYVNSVTGVQFAVAATGPEVTQGVLFTTANTSNTTINTFVANRGATLGAVEEPPDGKIIVVFFQDDSSTIATSRNIYLSTTMSTFNSGGAIALISVGSAWYELFRSTNFQASQTTRTEIATYTVANSFSVDATFVRVVNIISSAANSVLQSFSGGQAYQEITVVPTYAAGSTLFVSASGNIVLPSTGAMLLSNSGTYKFMYVPSGGGGTAFKWLMQKGGAATAVVAISTGTTTTISF